ncbi:MAG: class I SAM-dependent RNA methyltransferase, partial [Chloroflexota bacterium]
MNSENRVRVRLDAFAHLGEAIGRVDGQVIFVLGGLPGEEVVAEVFQRKADYLRGRLVEVLTPSPDRTEPPCPYFGRCGGCQLQHVNYARQLGLKHGVVLDQLRRLGGFTEVDVPPVLGMGEPWYYRNHARFSSLRDGTLGFTLANSRRLIHIEHCWLMYPPINRVLEQLQGHCRGLFNVSVRYGLRTGEMLISPQVKGVEPALATGQPYYEEELLERRFRIAAASFFQVNTAQADVLIRKVLDNLALDSDAVLVDAYCGVGTFGILAAPHARHVIGIEDSAAALVDATYNARGLTNIEFRRGATEHVLPVLDQRVDAVIIDPPRAGCKPEVLQALLDRRPRRLVYVSCEPSTLARDLRILVDGG